MTARVIGQTMEDSPQNNQEKNKIVIVEGEEKARQIVDGIHQLIKMIPNSSRFLGEADNSRKKRKRRLFSSDTPPNLNELRDEVVSSVEQKGVNNPRKKIKKLLKKYPNTPDLRALNGIQIFNDIAQSGLNEKKLQALKNALTETANALQNGGISIFNATWFIKIYLKYLETLRERLSKEVSSLNNHYHWHIQQGVKDLSIGLAEVNTLIGLKDKLNGLMILNAKMKNTVYITNCLTNEELRSAAMALKQDDTRTVGTGKTANYVIYVIITLSLLFARIPILEDLVRDILSAMPDTSRDIILQKNMIATMVGVTTFQITKGRGDTEKAKEVGLTLYKKCLTAISQHLEHALLSKPHEVDPFLKLAWIVKESEGLFESEEYKAMIVKAALVLKKILTSSSEVKGSIDLARQLQADIQDLYRKYGVNQY